jgi:transposase
LLADIGHQDAQRREVKKKLATAVTASGTSLTEIFGAGPVIAATVIGDVLTVARFPSRDHFAACNGTARSRCPPARRRSAGYPENHLTTTKSDSICAA